jgi:hypothetical protein
MKYKILGLDKNIDLDLHHVDSISDYLDKYEDIETYTDIYNGYVLVIDHTGSMGESKSEKIRKERDKKIDIITGDGK